MGEHEAPARRAPFVRRAAKTVIAGVGMVAVVGVQYEQVLPEEWRPWLQVLVAVATALGVYGVKNAPNEKPAR